jgi:Luciferase-like monooxygenase
MKLGLALRSTVFSPSSIAKIIPLLDRSEVDSVWFPSVGRAFDALDMCGISLGGSRRLRVGTGVVTTAEYDAARLLPRVHTLSEGSEMRFILGIGTGSGRGHAAVDGLVETATKLRHDYPEEQKPLIYFAALRKRVLRAAYMNADGAILNFCPPSHVRSVVPDDLRRKDFTLACYIKLFFAEEEENAKKMLVDELKMYDAIPQYHAMFADAGASDAIKGLSPASTFSEKITEISRANPTDEEVVGILGGFRDSGVDLPIIYPYVSGDERRKAAVVERLSALA